MNVLYAAGARLASASGGFYRPLMRNDRLFRPSRRGLLGAAVALPFLSIPSILRAAEPDLSALSPMTADVVPISRAERAARVVRAQTFDVPALQAVR